MDEKVNEGDGKSHTHKKGLEAAKITENLELNWNNLNWVMKCIPNHNNCVVFCVWAHKYSFIFVAASLMVKEFMFLLWIFFFGSLIECCCYFWGGAGGGGRQVVKKFRLKIIFMLKNFSRAF